MDAQGVSTYLLTVDPETLTVLWANENVEAALKNRGDAPAPGRPVADVVYLGEEIGVVDMIRRVAETGESKNLNTRSLPLDGSESISNASFYLLPTGQVLVASEWIKVFRDELGRRA